MIYGNRIYFAGQRRFNLLEKIEQCGSTEKIRKLLESISDNPYEGIGKPEPLKFGLTGCWSRRINQEHRIIYEVHPDKVMVLSMKGHY